MIRVYSVQDTIDNEGGWTIILTGHGSEKVCAGVSAILHAAVDGLERMAKENPRQLVFTRIKNGPLNAASSEREDLRPLDWGRIKRKFSQLLKVKRQR